MSTHGFASGSSSSSPRSLLPSQSRLGCLEAGCAGGGLCKYTRERIYLTPRSRALPRSRPHSQNEKNNSQSSTDGQKLIPNMIIHQTANRCFTVQDLGGYAVVESSKECSGEKETQDALIFKSVKRRKKGGRRCTNPIVSNV